VPVHSKYQSIPALFVIAGVQHSFFLSLYGVALMYRAGWEISKASILANIVLTILLVIIGAFFYKELLDMKKVAGVILCVIGIILLNR
jgi:uncharacterized membrane protein